MLEKREDLEGKGLQLTDEYKQLVDEINEKEKRVNYILEMPISEFEESLMELIRLIRNSLMYLSLAVHYEEREKSIDNDLILSREVPIK
jgi:transcription antitermination factor NusA-like protein